MGKMSVRQPKRTRVRAKSRFKFFVGFMLTLNLLVSTAALLKGFDLI